MRGPRTLDASGYIRDDGSWTLQGNVIPVECSLSGSKSLGGNQNWLAISMLTIQCPEGTAESSQGRGQRSSALCPPPLEEDRDSKDTLKG